MRCPSKHFNPGHWLGPSTANEAGFIYILDGMIGAQIDGEDVVAAPGDTVFIPRDASHTFWNATEARAEVLEIFTPAGLERWFRDLAEIVSSGSFDLDIIVESGLRFGTTLDLDSIQPLIDDHHLQFPI